MGWNMGEGVSVVGINWPEIHECDGVSFQGHVISKFNYILLQSYHFMSSALVLKYKSSLVVGGSGPKGSYCPVWVFSQYTEG